MSRPQEHDPAVIEAALRDYLLGDDLDAIAERCEVCRSTLLRWVREQGLPARPKGANDTPRMWRRWLARARSITPLVGAEIETVWISRTDLASGWTETQVLRGLLARGYQEGRRPTTTTYVRWDGWIVFQERAWIVHAYRPETVVVAGEQRSFDFGGRAA